MDLLIILYFVGFLRTLVVIAVIYFAIRVITRYVLPLLVDQGLKNMQQKMQDQQRNRQQHRPEGEVTIERDKQNQDNKIKDEGEYVDFEEVD